MSHKKYAELLELAASRKARIEELKQDVEERAAATQENYEIILKLRDKIAELERKLAGYEAKFFLMKNTVTGCDAITPQGKHSKSELYGHLVDGFEELNNLLAQAREEGRKEAVPDGWKPSETAPKDGTTMLVYRPLAHKTNDPNISIVRGIPRDSGCWEETVPDGMTPENYTDGYCKPTHWMPLPAPTKPPTEGEE